MIPPVLRLRDFRRLFLAQVVSTVGDFFVPVAISFAVLDLTGSVTDLGVVLFARVFGQVLFFLAGGVWADRLPRHHVMVGSNIVRLFSQGLLGVLLISGHAQIWQLAMQNEVHVDDEVITAGGLHAYVRELGDDVITVEIAPNVRVRLDRRAVAAVVRPEETVEEAENQPERVSQIEAGDG